MEHLDTVSSFVEGAPPGEVSRAPIPGNPAPDRAPALTSRSWMTSSPVWTLFAPMALDTRISNGRARRHQDPSDAPGRFQPRPRVPEVQRGAVYDGEAAGQQSECEYRHASGQRWARYLVSNTDCAKVIISSHNSLGDGRYYDVESSSSFQFDHTERVCPQRGLATTTQALTRHRKPVPRSPTC